MAGCTPRERSPTWLWLLATSTPLSLGVAEYQDAVDSADVVAKLLNVSKNDILIQSTGVIGQRIKKGEKDWILCFIVCYELADIALCSDCFHDARFVTRHSSLDFQRVDGKKDGSDNDGDSRTDQETLLLLEGIEKYNDNLNDIAEHVGTKSKVQCIHHFIRLPVEDGLFESIEVPDASVSSRVQSNGFLHSNSNSNTLGSFPQSSQPRHQLPFINSANPVMSLCNFAYVMLVFGQNFQHLQEEGTKCHQGD